MKALIPLRLRTLLGGLFFGIICISCNFTPEKIADLRVPTTAEARGQYYQDPCSTKSRCILFYIAPWCSSCHSAIPFFTAMQNLTARDARISSAVVMGRADKAEVTEWAFQLPFNVHMDYEHKLSGYFPGGVPSWIVMDRDHNILKRGTGVWGSSAGWDGSAKMFLDEATEGIW